MEAESRTHPIWKEDRLKKLRSPKSRIKRQLRMIRAIIAHAEKTGDKEFRLLPVPGNEETIRKRYEEIPRIRRWLRV